MSTRATHPRAGQMPEPADLLDVDRLLAAYHDERPDPSDPAQRVAFGTAGHRGSSLTGTFTDAHVAAVSEAVCRNRERAGVTGPLFLGRDTHALSKPALETIVEILAAHEVDVVIDADGGATPTPVISHAILAHNRGDSRGRADGILVTPSHNPPDDGGFKYNPTHGGPADTAVTGWIEREANALLESGLRGVRRIPFHRAAGGDHVHLRDYVSAYVDELPAVVDLDAIRHSRLRLGVDPLGGASLAYWHAIGERHGLDLTVVSDAVDPTFRFVPLDSDGKVRMDCSSPWAMSRLREMSVDFDVAFANDPDADRHGVVTPGAGLLNPNHMLAACVAYLFGGNREWGVEEVPVGFKWFVQGLADGTLGFAGEESAGASFLRRDGTVWSSDKDGFIPCLLAAEMKARTGRDPGEVYDGLTSRFGRAAYRRIDVPATKAQKIVLMALWPGQVPSSELAGEPIHDVLTTAPSNGVAIGGLKVVAEHGWFAARPSGTEDVYKVYAESLTGEEHLERILAEAQQIVSAALSATGAGAR